jgi:hypothetical protein
VEGEEMKWLLLYILLLIPSDVTAEIAGLKGVTNTTHTPPPALTSYHWTTPGNWTFWNKFWFTGAIVANGADVVSTTHQLSKGGCSEANPLFGYDPSTGVLVLGKVVLLGASYWYTEYILEGKPGQQAARNYLYGFQTLLMGAVAARNMSLDCGG